VRIAWWTIGIVLSALVGLATSVLAGEPVGAVLEKEARQDDAAGAQKTESPEWHYGGFVDLGYSLDFNFPENHLFRNRTTTPRVNELDLNMGGVYIRKEATEQSRLGLELAGQGGQDAKAFGFHVNQPKVGSSDQLRHFGRGNVSYLAPIGKGLTIQGGLFTSLVGYESLYAKDNFNYTRAWIADYSPYLMFGANASYPLTEQLTGTLFIINGYFHLSHRNNAPSYGAQLAYRVTPRLTVKETVFSGPEQADTSVQFWRVFNDTIIEWKEGKLALAFEYQAGTEELAATGQPRVFWMGGALYTRWQIQGPWSVAIRPELFWDPNGRITGSEQFVRAVTTTAEYRLPYERSNTIVRLEYRYDESTGSGGGFFRGGENRLTPVQNLLLFSIIWTFDSPLSP